jgi:predicted DNA-binding transcriptional regulator YafY
MDTPTRLLRLLGLLSARAGWSGAELAERLETTERTVRRDITRLRDLGYPIEATTGPYGGYELGSGGRLPPLVLDDDEAVAATIALRAVAGGGASGMESAALSALTKVEQVLPALLRERVSALANTTVGLRRGDVPPVNVETLITAALACRRSERLRFDYRDANEVVTNRLVDPYRVVFTARQWYLVAFDAARDDWRTFRVDRIFEPRLSGARFVPKPDAPDAAQLVARGVAIGAYSLQAVVRLHAPLERAAELLPPTVAVLEAAGDDTTIARIGGDADWIARYLAGLNCDFEILEPEEVRTELVAIATSLLERLLGQLPPSLNNSSPRSAASGGSPPMHE